MSTFSTGIDSQSFQVMIPLLSSKQSVRVTSNVQQIFTNVCAVPERWSSRRGWYPLQVRNFSPDILPRSHVFCNVIPQLESSKPGEGVRNQITCVSSHRLHHIFFLTDHFQKNNYQSDGALMLAGQVHGWKSSTSGSPPPYTVSKFDVSRSLYVLPIPFSLPKFVKRFLYLQCGNWFRL